MPDREKVIKGLECCLPMTGRNGIGDCRACPYDRKITLEGGITECCHKLMLEAHALLKAQEPHVMTLEEVKAMKRHTICAVEQRSKVLHTTFNAEYCGTITIGERNYLDFGLYADVNPFRRSEGGYGKTWRCWTSRSTDEQRKAVKWNGDN